LLANEGAEATAAGDRRDDPRDDQDSDQSIFAALGAASFRNLWLAELLSQTALNAIWYAALVATEKETHAAAFISYAVVSATLPVALFGVLAGILVDRWDKKRVLVVSNALRIALSLGYLWYGWSIGVIFLMNFLINAVAQFFSPAMLATIPQLLPKRLLTAATGLFNITLNISQVLVMVLLGPPLIKFVGPGVVFAVAAGIYAVATVLVATVPHAHEPPAREGRATNGALDELRHELREGWTFVRRDRESWLAMVYLALTWTILFALVTLAPRYAASAQGLRIDAGDAVFILAPAGLGMALAAAFLDRLTRRFGRWRLVGRSLLGLAGSLAVLALVAPFVHYLVRHGFDTLAARRAAHMPIIFVRAGLAMVVSLVVGWWVGLVTVSSEGVILERAPQALRGRIFALQLTFTNLASIVPLLAVGHLADMIGLNEVIALTALAVLTAWLITAASLAASRSAERVGRGSVGA
jgi:MFS family permease